MEEKVVEQVQEKVETVVEQVKEKVEDAVEQNLETIEVKVSETADKVLDKTEEVVEKTAEKIGEAVEEKVEEILKKVEDIPIVGKAVEAIAEGLVDQVDGRMFSCSCGSWQVSLRISRKDRSPPPSKSAESENKQSLSPSQDTQPKESLPPKPPQSE